MTDPDGLLKLFTKNVLETSLVEEMTEHLGHEKNRAEPGLESTNVRNGSRTKTVISDAAGEVEIEVPQDREGTFEPQIVKKRQCRLTDVDEIVLSLYARNFTTREISAHFAEIYGASVSKETVSRITDKVVAEMNAWAGHPLDAVYAAVFLDAIVVKVRDGQVANPPVCAASGVTVDGRKDVLGCGWRPRRGRQVLDERAGRFEEPRRARRILLGLRWAQGPTRRGGERVAADRRADLCGALDPQHVPAGSPSGLGCGETGHPPDLHRAHPGAAAAAPEDLAESTLSVETGHPALACHV